MRYFKLNPSVNSIALTAIGYKYYIVFIVCDAIMLVIGYFIVVETRGLTLEEIAIVFDGHDALISEGVDKVDKPHHLEHDDNKIAEDEKTMHHDM